MSRATLAVGRIVKPHGVRGELKVALHWAGSTSLGDVDHVRLVPENGAPVVFRVESVRRTPKGPLLKVVGVDDLDAAERWRGAAVEVERAALPPLEPGAYYLVDLVGARVVGPSGELGRVVEVRPYQTVDTIVVEDSAGVRREHPLVEPWLRAVDPISGIVELTGTDGFLD